jgi:hypothetical protein
VQDRVAIDFGQRGVVADFGGSDDHFQLPSTAQMAKA